MLHSEVGLEDANGKTKQMMKMQTRISIIHDHQERWKKKEDRRSDRPGESIIESTRLENRCGRGESCADIVV
jgi:hypothetical protein